MEDNKWMIVRKEKISTKIKNYFKNIFSKMLNNSNKKKKNKSKGLWPKRKEVHAAEQKESVEYVQPKMTKEVKAEQPRKNKEITIEVAENRKRPKEIVIEYENKNKPKKKEIVVEYENKKSQHKNVIPEKKVASKNDTNIKNNMVSKNNANLKNKKEKSNDFNQKNKVQQEKKIVHVEVKPKQEQKKLEIPIKKKEVVKKAIPMIQKEINQEPIKTEPKQELALKPVKAKKERKPLNIFQLFKDKERKKRKEILNRIRENKVDDYETISTKTKLSKGSIAVDDVDANELDPLIDLYRDSNKKLMNRIKASQQ